MINYEALARITIIVHIIKMFTEEWELELNHKGCMEVGESKEDKRRDQMRNHQMKEHRYKNDSHISRRQRKASWARHPETFGQKWTKYPVGWTIKVQDKQVHKFKNQRGAVIVFVLKHEAIKIMF